METPGETEGTLTEIQTLTLTKVNALDKLPHTRDFPRRFHSWPNLPGVVCLALGLRYGNNNA